MTNRTFAAFFSAIFIASLFYIYFGGSGYGWIAERDGKRICIVPVTHLGQSAPSRPKDSILDCLNESKVLALETVWQPREAWTKSRIDALRRYENTLSTLPPAPPGHWEGLAEVLKTKFPGEPIPTSTGDKSGAHIGELVVPIVLGLYGFGYNQSVEAQIVSLAEQRGLRVIGLEKHEDQYELMGRFAAKTTDYILLDLAKKIESGDAYQFINELNNAWSSGSFVRADLEISRQHSKYRSEALGAIVIASSRNAFLAAQADLLAKEEGTITIAIGVLHFAGGDDIRRHLTALGYSIREI